MDVVWKERWVAALRSGQYEQGLQHLHKDGRYCCLGVLCDLVKDELKKDWNDEGYFLESCYYLPYEVQELVGLNVKDPRVKRKKDEASESLTSLNDYTSIGFQGIADLIEEQL